MTINYSSAYVTISENENILGATTRLESIFCLHCWNEIPEDLEIPYDSENNLYCPICGTCFMEKPYE